MKNIALRQLIKYMNWRIKHLAKHLAEQARKHFPKTELSGEYWVLDEEKFAMLIIQECIEINRKELAFPAFDRLMHRYQTDLGV